VLGGRAEVEGGEYIVNRKASEIFRPQLDAINSYNGWGDASSGGKNSFARGGTLPTLDRASLQNQPQATQIITQPVLVLEDLRDVESSIARAQQIQIGF
jgi:hypothetical protein